MKISINVIGRGNRCIVAACDADLLGKTLRLGKINFEVRRDFYQGSLVDVKEAIELINEVGPPEHDSRLDRRQIHAPVAARDSKHVVPVGAVHRVPRGEVLNPRHVA